MAVSEGFEWVEWGGWWGGLGESELETFGGVCSSVLRVLEPSLSSGEPPELCLPLLFLFCGGDFLFVIVMISPTVLE